MVQDILFESINEETSKLKEARIKELEGLKDAEVLTVVKPDTIPKANRVYGTRFVDKVKKQMEDLMFSSLG